MLIKVQRQDHGGNVAAATVNTKFLTSALYVENVGLTALNMHNQPTIWVTNTPSEIMWLVNTGENDV